MRVSSGNKSRSVPGIRSVPVGAVGVGGDLRCRVVRKQVTDRPAGRPDWDRIPSRRTLPMGARDWTRRIQEQGARDAVYGRALSAQTERLLVAYVSRSSPDRRRVYEALFQRYGDRLESYRAADGSNMRNVNGMWEYDLTEAEAHMVEAFMEIYGPAFETARADFLASGRLFREV